MVNKKLSLYNEYTKAQPQYYSATTETFIDLKKNSNGQWQPASNTNWFMDIAVNGVIGDRSYAITTPEKWFFYIPGERGLSVTEKEVANSNGFTTNRTLKIISVGISRRESEPLFNLLFCFAKAM